MNALQLSAEAQSLLDAHLDAVERVLLNAGLSRAERQTICDEIQSQARDMLEARGVAAPTVADMQAVLAAMDPPDSYRDSAAPTAPKVPAKPTRLHPAALWSVILPAAAFLLMFLPFGPKGEGAGLTFLGATALIAVALGVASIVAVRSRPDRWRGVGLAAIGICLLPSIFLAILANYQWGPALHWSIVKDANHRDQQIHERDTLLAARDAELHHRMSQLEAMAPGAERELAQREFDAWRQQISKWDAELAAHPIAPLTEREKWTIEHRNTLRAACTGIILSTMILASLFAMAVIYHFCRPRIPAA